MRTRTKTWRGRAAYEALLAERERDGLTFAELARRSGVPESTLQRWARRLQREHSAQTAPFVELVARPAADAAPAIELRLRSGRSIAMPAGPPFAGLHELVTLLESC